MFSEPCDIAKDSSFLNRSGLFLDKHSQNEDFVYILLELSWFIYLKVNQAILFSLLEMSNVHFIFKKTEPET